MGQRLDGLCVTDTMGTMVELASQGSRWYGYFIDELQTTVLEGDSRVLIFTEGL